MDPKSLSSTVKVCIKTSHDIFFYSVSSVKLKVIVPFVDIGRIVDYHCLNFLFVNYLYVFNGHDRKHVICNTIYTAPQKML